MKKGASLFLAILLLLCTACGNTKANNSQEPFKSPVIDTGYDKPEEYTYTEPEYDYSEPDPDDYLESTPRSSCFSAVGYDWDNEVLYVQFRDSGSIYAYDVPSYIYDELISADSMGKYYNSYIKGEYPSTHIS